MLLFLSVSIFPQSADPQPAWVKKVVDGDTLPLTNGKGNRLIGGDTHTAFLFNGEIGWGKRFPKWQFDL